MSDSARPFLKPGMYWANAAQIRPKIWRNSYNSTYRRGGHGLLLRLVFSNQVDTLSKDALFAFIEQSQWGAKIAATD